MSREPTIFVVDDDPAARDSVVTLVAAHGAKAAAFAGGEEFLAEYDPAQPGCLVLDLRMMDMGGLELQEQLNSRGIQIPIIITSGYADVPSSVKAMESGAVTVLEKPYSPEQLWTRIRQAFALDAHRRANRARREDVGSRLARLTPQERRVMDLVVAGALNKVIARTLSISLRTVERDRASVLEKMGVDSLAQLVEKVLSVRRD